MDTALMVINAQNGVDGKQKFNGVGLKMNVPTVFVNNQLDHERQF